MQCRDACRALCGGQASAVVMTKDEERELREQLARLQQERRDLRPAALAGLRSVAGSATEKAQARPARPHFLYRGPAHPRHYCVAVVHYCSDISLFALATPEVAHSVRSSLSPHSARGTSLPLVLITPAGYRPRGSPWSSARSLPA